MSVHNESIVEDATLTWLGELDYTIAHGPHMVPGEQAGGSLTPTFSQRERESYSEVALVGRLREAIRRLSPAIPEEARAIHKKYLSVENTTKYGRTHE